MKFGVRSGILLCMALLLTGCGSRTGQKQEQSVPTNTEAFTRQSKIEDVIYNPAFGSYGWLLFSTDEYYYSGDTLKDLKLVCYSHIDPDETVEIVNTLKQRAQAGQSVFYDIYTDEEKEADPAKEDTGLFFFKGTPGEKFAICNAGGAFAYVGAMQDSFPHALELSGKGYNAFALIYRPGAVVMQYTGLSEYSELDPPTYACVGDRDGIANWRIIQARLNAMQQAGIDTEFHMYPGLGHGFGLGAGTSAEGWLNDAAAFWEKQMDA